MKCLLAMLVVLPCLAEPDIFSWSPFLNRYIWSVEPTVLQAAGRVYPYQLGNTWLLSSGVALGGQRIVTPSIIGSSGYLLPSLSVPGVRNIGRLGIQDISPANIVEFTRSAIATPSASFHSQPIPSVRNIIDKPGPTGPLNSIVAVPDQPHLNKVGELPQRVPEMHPMKGSVYFNDENESQIIVRGFYYPNPGPDAFFWAGEDLPSCSEESVSGRSYSLAPGQVGSSDYFSENQPILPAYSGDQGDLVLTLPPGVSTRNLKWICVWCRKFTANFGTLEMNLP